MSGDEVRADSLSSNYERATSKTVLDFQTPQSQISFAQFLSSQKLNEPPIGQHHFDSSYEVAQVHQFSPSTPQVPNPYKHLHQISRNPYVYEEQSEQSGVVAGGSPSVPRNSPDSVLLGSNASQHRGEFSVMAQKGQQIVTADHSEASLMQTEMHIPHSIATLSERDLQMIQERREKRASNLLLSLSTDSRNRTLHSNHFTSPGVENEGRLMPVLRTDAGYIESSQNVWSEPSNMEGLNGTSHGTTGAFRELRERNEYEQRQMVGVTDLSHSSAAFPPTFQDPSMASFPGAPSRKSGLLWRKPDRGGGKPERCRCTVEEGIFEVQMLGTADLGLDEAFDLTQWRLDERFSFREQITLVDHARNRLIRFDADSVDLAEEWKLVLRRSEPDHPVYASKSQRVSAMVSRSKQKAKSAVMTAWKNNLFVRARRLEFQVLHRSISVIWREWFRYRSLKKQRRLIMLSPEMEARELERCLGLSRLTLAHWRVVTSRCRTALVTKDHDPARTADDGQLPLKAGQLVASFVTSEQGWTYGMRLPSNRWDAVKTNLRKGWFPTDSVEVVNDGQTGYWGRAGPMSLTVIGVRNLPVPPEENKTRTDTYCTVHVHDGRRTTESRRNAVSPDWVQSFAFDVADDDHVTVMVWEWDKCKQDELIGYMHVSAQQLLHDCEGARLGSELAVQSGGHELDVASLFRGARGYKLFSADGDVLVGSDREESVLLLDCHPMRWEFPKRLDQLPEELRPAPPRSTEPVAKDIPKRAMDEAPAATTDAEPESFVKKEAVPKLQVMKPTVEAAPALPETASAVPPAKEMATEPSAEAVRLLQDLSASEAVSMRGTSHEIPDEAAPASNSSGQTNEPQVLYPPSSTPRGTNPQPHPQGQQATPPQHAAPSHTSTPTTHSQSAAPSQVPRLSSPAATHPSVASTPMVPQFAHPNLFPKKFRVILVGAIGLPKRWIGHYDHSVMIECRNVASGNVLKQQTRKVPGQNVSWEERFDCTVEDHASTVVLQIPQVGNAAFSADDLQRHADQCSQQQPPLQWMGHSQGSGSHKLFQSMTKRYPTAFPCPLNKSSTRSTASFKSANPVLLLHVTRLDPLVPVLPSLSPSFPQQSTPPEPHQPPQPTPPHQQPPQVRSPSGPDPVYTDVSVQALASKLPAPKVAPTQPTAAGEVATAAKTLPEPAASTEISQAAPVTKTEDAHAGGSKVAALALSFSEGGHSSASASQTITPRGVDAVSAAPAARDGKDTKVKEQRGGKADLTISEAPGPKGFTMAVGASDGEGGDDRGNRVGGAAADFPPAFDHLSSPRPSPRVTAPKEITISYPVTLEVSVVGARYLPFGCGPKCVSFCLLQVGDSQVHTRTWSDNIEPQWRESFTLEMVDSQDLVISLVQSNDSLAGQFVGVVRMAPERIIRGYVLPRDKHHAKRSAARDNRSGGLAISDEISLHKVIGHDGRPALDSAERACELALRFRLVGGGKVGQQDADKSAAVPAKDQKSMQLMAPRDRELIGLQSPTRLYLRLDGGRNLPGVGGMAQCNPYCKVRVGEHRFQSQVCLDTLHPEWEHDIDFEVNRGDEIAITVLDWDFLKMDRVIGVVKVSAERLLQDSTEAKAKSEQTKDSGPVSIVLQSTNKQEAVAVSHTPMRQSLSAGGKPQPSQTAFKSLLAVQPEQAVSPFNSGLVALKGELESRQSGCINYKVFSASGAELKSRSGLQTCVALRCQTTPFEDTTQPETTAEQEVPQEPVPVAIQNGEADVRVADPPLPAPPSWSNVKIEVMVLAARHLPGHSKDAAEASHHCILQLGAQTEHTSVRSHCANPVFCEQIEFNAPRDIPDLFVSVMRKGRHSADEPLGVVQVPVMAMKDSARRAQMEAALSGLQFPRPRDHDEDDDGAVHPSLSKHPMPSDCENVPDSLFHRRYPGMKSYDLSGDNGVLVTDQHGRKTALLLRCLVVDPNAANTFTPGLTARSTPAAASKEAPIALSLKFSGDVQRSLAEDAAALSRWKKQLRSDLAASLGASKQRFGVVSLEVTDGIIANLVVLPLWMLPGLSEPETKTARAVAANLVTQIRNPVSPLRTASPYLVQNVEVTTEDAEINELPQQEYEDSSDDLASSVHTVHADDTEDHDAPAVSLATRSPSPTGSPSSRRSSQMRSPAASWIQKEASPVRPVSPQMSDAGHDPVRVATAPQPRPSVPHVVDHKAAHAPPDSRTRPETPTPSARKSSSASLRTLATREDVRRTSVGISDRSTEEASRFLPSPENSRPVSPSSAVKSSARDLRQRKQDSSYVEDPNEVSQFSPSRMGRGSGRRERRHNAKRWFEDRQFRRVQDLLRGWSAVARQAGWGRTRGYLSARSDGLSTEQQNLPRRSREQLRWTSPPIQIQTPSSDPTTSGRGASAGGVNARLIGADGDTKWAMGKCVGCGSYKRKDRVSAQGLCRKCERQSREASSVDEDVEVYREGIC